MLMKMSKLDTPILLHWEEVEVLASFSALIAGQVGMVEKAPFRSDILPGDEMDMFPEPPQPAPSPTPAASAPSLAPSSSLLARSWLKRLYDFWSILTESNHSEIPGVFHFVTGKSIPLSLLQQQLLGEERHSPSLFYNCVLSRRIESPSRWRLARSGLCFLFLRRC